MSGRTRRRRGSRSTLRPPPSPRTMVRISSYAGPAPPREAQFAARLADAKIETLLTSATPLAVAVITTIARVWAGIGIERPVTMPLPIVPGPMMPVRDGVAVTVAPGTGVKKLFGPDDVYSCAVIV